MDAQPLGQVKNPRVGQEVDELISLHDVPFTFDG
jgi:hypothetical protein